MDKLCCQRSGVIAVDSVLLCWISSASTQIVPQWSLSQSFIIINITHNRNSSLTCSRSQLSLVLSLSYYLAPQALLVKLPYESRGYVIRHSERVFDFYEKPVHALFHETFTSKTMFKGFIRLANKKDSHIYSYKLLTFFTRNDHYYLGVNTIKIGNTSDGVLLVDIFNLIWNSY